MIPKRFCSWIAVAALVLGQVVVAPRVVSAQTVEQQVDQSVVRALAYLSRQQEPNGAWRIDSFGESTAATSLAVMAFMAAGHVPDEGPFGKQISRGIEWVIDHQQANGMIIHSKSHGPLYSHGISTLMLAEVAGMVREPLASKCRQALERAVRLILEAQNVPKGRQHEGGWRYQVSSKDSDLSVTGWQLLALRAAKNIGCDVPAENIDRAVDYVKRCKPARSQGFGYQPGGAPTATRTGTGILALEICGSHHSPEALDGADYLIERPLQFKDHYFFYGVYYCSVGMFKIGDKYWEETKNHLVAILLTNQLNNGSWQALHGSERSAGSVYTTCMAVLALAVEYRYLPIYQR